MSGGRRTALGLAAVLTVAATAAAADQPPVELGGPLVVKLSWGARALVAHDLDGDGRTDLALIDNDHARLDLLYQRRPGEPNTRGRRSGLARWEPVLEDAPFRRETVATGIRGYALAVGDLDGDGRPDLVYTGRPDGLTVRYQDRKGDFERSRVLSDEDATGWISSLVVGDVDGDGRDDLAVLAKSALLVYRQRADGVLVGPDRYPLVGEDRHGLDLVDVDGDGRPDLLYQVPAGDHTLRLRLASARGELGAERTLELPPSRSTMQRLADPGAAPLLARIDAATGLVETLAIAHAADREFRFDALGLRVMAAHRGDGGKAAIALGDFDGDGLLDLAVANPDTASLALLRQDADGGFVRSAEFPSLAGVRAVAAGDLDGDGRAELVLASPKEKVVAVTSLAASGRFEYPQPLPVAGEPFGVVVADLLGDAAPEIAAVTEPDKDRRVVAVLHRETGGEWAVDEIELADLKVPPKALAAIDADQDGALDLAVFAVREPVRLLLNRGADGFVPAAEAAGFQRGLLDGVEPAGLTAGDVDGDGRPEMLVASGGFARALRLRAEDGQLEVVDQFNPRSSETKIGAAVTWDPDHDGVTDIGLVHADGAGIELLQRAKDGVFRYRDALATDPVALRRAVVADLAGSGDDDLLLLGEDVVVWVPTARDGLRATRTTIWEPDLEDVEPDTVATGDLGGDPRAEIVLVDAAGSHVAEVLTRGDGDEWTSALRFTVFEADPHYQGQEGAAREPREVLVADVTDDGRPDLVLLVHDRLLVYPQIQSEAD